MLLTYLKIPSKILTLAIIVKVILPMLSKITYGDVQSVGGLRQQC